MNKCPEFLPDQANQNLSEILNPKKEIPKIDIIAELEAEGFF